MNQDLRTGSVQINIGGATVFTISQTRLAEGSLSQGTPQEQEQRGAQEQGRSGSPPPPPSPSRRPLAAKNHRRPLARGAGPRIRGWTGLAGAVLRAAVTTTRERARAKRARARNTRCAGWWPGPRCSTPPTSSESCGATLG